MQLSWLSWISCIVVCQLLLIGFMRGRSNYQIGGTYYQNQECFIMYACQKDHEQQENWTKWELGLHISKPEPLS